MTEDHAISLVEDMTPPDWYADMKNGRETVEIRGTFEEAEAGVWAEINALAWLRDEVIKLSNERRGRWDSSNDIRRTSRLGLMIGFEGVLFSRKRYAQVSVM